MATKMANEALVRNLCYRWTKELILYSDKELVAYYDEFAISEMWGNNDERFLEFLKS